MGSSVEQSTESPSVQPHIGPSINVTVHHPGLRELLLQDAPPARASANRRYTRHRAEAVAILAPRRATPLARSDERQAHRANRRLYLHGERLGYRHLSEAHSRRLPPGQCQYFRGRVRAAFFENDEY